MVATVPGVLRWLADDGAFLHLDTYQPVGEAHARRTGVVQQPGRMFRVGDVQSHQERFNLSLRGKKLVVPLTGEPVWEPHHYLVVYNGGLHTPQMRVQLNQEKTYGLLQEAGLVGKASFDAQAVHSLDLTSLPILLPEWADPLKGELVDCLRNELMWKQMIASLKLLAPSLPKLLPSTKSVLLRRRSTLPRAILSTNPERPKGIAQCVVLQLVGHKEEQISVMHIEGREEAYEELDDLERRLRRVRCRLRVQAFALHRYDGVKGKTSSSVVRKGIERFVYETMLQGKRVRMTTWEESL